MAKLNAAFWEWFGDSVVRNEDGTPKVMYHYGQKKISVFNIDLCEFGCHFGTKRQSEDAGPLNKRTGCTHKCYISMQNPFRMQDGGAWGASMLWQFVRVIDEAILDRMYRTLVGRKEWSEIRRLLEDAGYDGIVYLNRVEGIRDESELSKDEIDEMCDEEFIRHFPSAEDSYLIFHPWQIKSIDNDGTWDRDDQNIRSNPPVRASWAIHSTYREHLPSIAEHGLQPYVSHMFPERGPVVFFCEIGDGECMSPYLEGVNPDVWALLRFPWPEQYDDLGSEFAARAMIPSSQLQVFTKSGRWMLNHPDGWYLMDDDKYWKPLVNASNPPVRPDGRPDVASAFTLPAGTILYHGSPEPYASRIRKTGKLIVGLKHKLGGGSLSEGGLVWFATDRRIAEQYARGSESGRHSSAKGSIFAYELSEPLRVAGYYMKLNQEQADILNAVIPLPDYKALGAGEHLGLAAYRAYELERLREKYPRYRTSGGEMMVIWPTILRAIGFDAYAYGTTGEQIAIPAEALPVRAGNPDRG
jgi:hypothetical protein